MSSLHPAWALGKHILITGANGFIGSHLVERLQAAGARVIGVGALIEKTFEGGRELLEAAGMKVETLARITSMTDDRIVFAE